MKNYIININCFPFTDSQKTLLLKTQFGAWEYDIVGPWYKCNMTDVVAGIGLAQMKRYKRLTCQKKRNNWKI